MPQSRIFILENNKYAVWGGYNSDIKHDLFKIEKQYMMKVKGTASLMLKNNKFIPTSMIEMTRDEIINGLGKYT